MPGEGGLMPGAGGLPGAGGRFGVDSSIAVYEVSFLPIDPLPPTIINRLLRNEFPN